MSTGNRGTRGAQFTSVENIEVGVTSVIGDKLKFQRMFIHMKLLVLQTLMLLVMHTHLLELLTFLLI